MARFDVYSNPVPEQRRAVPYLLDVQTDFLGHLTTRIVIPLRKMTGTSQPMTRLNPCFHIDSHEVFADTANLAAIPGALLKKRVGSLSSEQLDIVNALDMLFTGF